MSLETASFISQLNVANPPGGDPIANAADHLRLIKSVLQSQFPSLGTSAVSATAAQLTYGVVPTGGIIAFSGTSAPTGWGLCDGTTYNKTDGSGTIGSPDLRDRFIIGGGGSYAVWSAGGAASHIHTLGINGTSLTLAQLPSIPVTIYDPGHAHGVNDPGHSHTYQAQTSPGASGAGGAGLVGQTSATTSSSGTGISIQGAGTGIWAQVNGTGGQAHTHTGNSDWQSNIPPYYALSYIMKL